MCYQEQGNITDLTKVIELGETTLDLCPTGHPENGLSLNFLAIALKACYEKLSDLTDMNKTIGLQE